MMRNRIISMTLVSGLLLSALSPIAGATKTASNEDYATFRQDFFQDAPANEPFRESATVATSENPDEMNIIHMPQTYLPITEDDSDADFVGNLNLNDVETMSYSINATRDFYVYATSGVRTAAKGTLMAQGDHCNVWLIAQTGGSPGDMSDYYDDIVDRVDDIYELMTTELAAHEDVYTSTGYSVLPYVGDIDQDGKINVLLYDIHSDGATASSYVAGFFYNGDFFTSINGVSQIATDAIHVDIGTIQGYSNLTTGDGDDFFGTIAHEFQHMLFYIYCGWKVTDSNSDLLWFNESLSGLTDMYYSTGDKNQGQIADDGKMILSNGTSYANGTTYGDFVNFSNSFKNYGMGYLFSAMMYEKTDGDYGSLVYEYLQTITKSQYSGSDGMAQLVSDTLDHVLGSDYDSSTTFEYLYYAFMENYLADGGDVIDGETTTSTYRLWEDGYLWNYKDTKVSYSSYDNTYDDLKSGDTFSLVGFPSDNSTVDATHEATYGLVKETSDGNYLNITVGESTDTFQAYVALYDSASTTADLYPLTTGTASCIDTDGKTPYFFAVTLYEDVEATTIQYTWTDEVVMPQVSIDHSLSGTILTVAFDVQNEVPENQHATLTVGFYNDGKLADIQQFTDLNLSEDHKLQLASLPTYTEYKLFLTDAQWDYAPLVTQTQTRE